MLCSAGESSVLAAPVMLWAVVNVATIIMHSAEIVLFMACLIFDLEETNRGRRFQHDGHRGWLIQRADTAGLPGAACLSGSSVRAVAPTVGGHHVGKRIVEAFGFSVYAIAERQPVLRGIHQDALDGSQRDVKHIVYRSTSVGIASRVAGDEAEPQLAAHRGRGNARVEPQKIGYRSCIFWPAPRTDGRLVLHQKQQVSARIGWNRHTQGT